MFAHAKKVRYGEDGWQLVRLNPSHEEVLPELGPIPRTEDAPKKKPAPPKQSEGKPASKESEGDLANGKRRRGRPKGSRNRPKTDAGATGAS